MAEKIINGSFYSDLSSWSNIGAGLFVWDVARMAKAASRALSVATLSHILTQAISISGSAQSAELTVRIFWNVAGGSAVPGQVVFNVKLIDPDSISTTVATVTKAPGSGEQLLCDALDVSAYMTKVGTYTVRLEALCNSGRSDDDIDVSYGWYDDISLLVVERLTKVVIEYLGGGELSTRVGVEQLEYAAMAETLSDKRGKWASNKMGLKESIRASIESNEVNTAAMSESYSYFEGKRRLIPKAVMSMLESLVAKWKLGNVTISRDIISEAGIWTMIDPVETDWEMG